MVMALHIQLAPTNFPFSADCSIPTWLTQRLNIISECLSDLSKFPQSIKWHWLLSHLVEDCRAQGIRGMDSPLSSTAPSDIHYVLAKSHLPACFQALKELARLGNVAAADRTRGLGPSGMRFAMDFANSQAPDAGFDNQLSATMDILQVRNHGKVTHI